MVLAQPKRLATMATWQNDMKSKAEQEIAHLSTARQSPTLPVYTYRFPRSYSARNDFKNTIAK